MYFKALSHLLLTTNACQLNEIQGLDVFAGKFFLTSDGLIKSFVISLEFNPDYFEPKRQLVFSMTESRREKKYRASSFLTLLLFMPRPGK